MEKSAADRKTSARGLETRSRILRATRELLVEAGASSFSLRSVAARAGISLSNLQFHHRDQTGLLSALLADELTRGRDLVAPAFVDVADPDDVLSRVLDALLDQQRDADAMRLYLALWSLAASDDALRVELEAFYARFVDDIVVFLAARGATPSVDTLRGRARVAVAFLEGLALFRSGVAGTFPERDEALVKSTLLELLGARPHGDRVEPRT